LVAIKYLIIIIQTESEREKKKRRGVKEGWKRRE